MKKIVTAFAFLFLLHANFSYAQLDTSNGRYFNEVFSGVTTSNDVVFGSYINFGFQTNLTMDIYQPTGDASIARPLIVWAHGGSFQFGDKSESDIVSLCQTFAKRGYVCASINYRTGFFPIDSVNATKAVLKATQDMKAAVRFFRKDAATANTYRIHPDYVYVGGSSAGAFMALHLAYMDKTNEFPLGASTLASLDGLEGNSGNPGYPSNASAVINLCGALADANFIEPGDIPLVSMHGNADATVPYGHAIIVSLGYSVMYVDGSAPIHARATTLGLNNPFYTFSGADHVPYLNNNSYLDTTIYYVRDFLFPLVAAAPTKVKQLEKESDWVVYPNPATSRLMLQWDEKLVGAKLELLNIYGQVMAHEIYSESNAGIDLTSLSKGIYILRIQSKDNTIQAQKIVVE